MYHCNFQTSSYNCCSIDKGFKDPSSDFENSLRVYSRNSEPKTKIWKKLKNVNIFDAYQCPRKVSITKRPSSKSNCKNSKMNECDFMPTEVHNGSRKASQVSCQVSCKGLMTLPTSSTMLSKISPIASLEYVSTGVHVAPETNCKACNTSSHETTDRGIRTDSRILVSKETQDTLCCRCDCPSITKPFNKSSTKIKSCSTDLIKNRKICDRNKLLSQTGKTHTPCRINTMKPGPLKCSPKCPRKLSTENSEVSPCNSYYSRSSVNCSDTGSNNRIRMANKDNDADTSVECKQCLKPCGNDHRRNKSFGLNLEQPGNAAEAKYHCPPPKLRVKRKNIVNPKYSLNSQKIPCCGVDLADFHAECRMNELMNEVRRKKLMELEGSDQCELASYNHRIINDINIAHADRSNDHEYENAKGRLVIKSF